MSEASVPLSAVLDWLTRTDRETVAGLIAGCALDDGDSDETFAIHGLDWSDAGKPVALVLRDGRRLPVRRLAATAHLVDRRPGAPLAAAIEAARKPADPAENEMRKVLSRAGIDADRLRSAAARRAVAVVAWKLERERVPSGEERQAAYLALIAGDDALASRGKLIFRRLVEICQQQHVPVPEDCHWRLACLARTSGDLLEAVAASDILHRHDRPKDDVCRKLLAARRCAALIDLWEVNAQAALLREAEKAFKVAWAVAPREEEVDALRGRLNRAIERAGIAGR
nr:hypothetical protein [uncultured Rhodopila sp.]